VCLFLRAKKNLEAAAKKGQKMPDFSLVGSHNFEHAQSWVFKLLAA
jgi:hypothetical protein